MLIKNKTDNELAGHITQPENEKKGETNKKFDNVFDLFVFSEKFLDTHLAWRISLGAFTLCLI